MMQNMRWSIIFLLCVGMIACRRDNPYQTAEDLLKQGRPRDAVNVLAAIPWSSPQIMAARRLMATTCARVPLVRSELVQSPLRVEVMEVVAELPHDTSCITEGLEVDAGQMLESCGEYKRSLIRRSDLNTGKVLTEKRLDRRYFAEGLTKLGNELFVLTWLEAKALVFDSGMSSVTRSFTVQGEGWGLTHDGSSLISSNGTNELRFLDPATGRIQRTVSVFNGDVPLMNLNELEYVEGEILANVWLTDRIARVDPRSGRLLGWILAEGLLPDAERFKAGVLNGIAYDASRRRLFVTGKRWPNVFEVRLVPIAK